MDLRDLYITSAAEVDVGNSSRKAIIIHVRPHKLPSRAQLAQLMRVPPARGLLCRMCTCGVQKSHSPVNEAEALVHAELFCRLGNKHAALVALYDGDSAKVRRKCGSRLSLEPWVVGIESRQSAFVSIWASGGGDMQLQLMRCSAIGSGGRHKVPGAA